MFYIFKTCHILWQVLILKNKFIQTTDIFTQRESVIVGYAF